MFAGRAGPDGSSSWILSFTNLLYKSKFSCSCLCSLDGQEPMVLLHYYYSIYFCTTIVHIFKPILCQFILFAFADARSNKNISNKNNLFASKKIRLTTHKSRTFSELVGTLWPNCSSMLSASRQWHSGYVGYICIAVLVDLSVEKSLRHTSVMYE